MADDSSADRLEKAVELTLKIAGGDLQARGETSEAGDSVDAIIAGLNMLAEDLAAETTARARAEDLLRDERNAYEDAPGLFCSVDAKDFKIIKCNRTMAKTFGKSKEEILNHSILELCDPEEHWQLESYLQQLLVDPETTPELRMVGAEGSMTATMHATQTTASNGDKRWRIILQDITRRKEAEDKLHEREQQLQSLLSSSPDNLCLLDRDHRIKAINWVEAALQIDDVVGSSFLDFVQPSDRQRIKSQLDRVVLHRENQQWELAYLRKSDGTTAHYSSIACPIVVRGEVTGSVVSSRDVSEQLKLETQNAQLEEQMRHTQKMEAVGRLAGGVAHDFNNILTAILGNAALAQLDLNSDIRTPEPLEDIIAAAERAADLTSQLLVFSRKQVISPKLICMDTLLAEIHPMLVRLIGEDIDLRTSAGDPFGAVMLDPGQAQQIVLNLVINARDAMPAGGTILVETSFQRIEQGDTTTEVGSVPPGDYVLLAVSDTGCGMPPEVRERIFEPFFTTKELGKGTGLGLATVFAIVSQCGGKIEVYTEPGMGTSFKLYFPRQQGEASVAQDQRPPRTKPRGGSETILVVEDEDMVRNLAVGLLGRLGYKTISARCGETALERSADYRETIDLLLTDVVMPGINGHTLAEQLVPMRPGLKVLYTSGYPKDIIVHKGVLKRGLHFIAKPYSLDSLAAKVREVLDLKEEV